MPIGIPLRNDLPYFGLQILLDGVTYQLDFCWNVRATRDIDGKPGAWFMIVKDQAQENILVGSQRLAIGYPLLSGLTARPMPGFFIVTDTSGQGLDPDIDELGVRVILTYWSPSDFE